MNDHIPKLINNGHDIVVVAQHLLRSVVYFVVVHVLFRWHNDRYMFSRSKESRAVKSRQPHLGVLCKYIACVTVARLAYFIPFGGFVAALLPMGTPADKGIGN